jgi:soluble lytic murein transglycosylase-like protein
MKRFTQAIHPKIIPLIGSTSIWLVTLGLAILLLLVGQSLMNRIQATVEWAKMGQTAIPPQTDPQAIPHLPDLGDPAWPDRPAPVNPVTKTRLTYEEMFQEIAERYGLDWRLLAEVAYQESRLNPLVLGKDNDMGLMQIIPSTWNEWAPKVGVTDPFDPYSNVLVGAAYLAYVREYAMARGYAEPHWMLIGYNWGPDNLAKLFASNGDWAQVPARQRSYALQILQAVSTQSNRWQTQAAAETSISSASLAPIATGRPD